MSLELPISKLSIFSDVFALLNVMNWIVRYSDFWSKEHFKLCGFVCELINQYCLDILINLINVLHFPTKNGSRTTWLYSKSRVCKNPNYVHCFDEKLWRIYAKIFFPSNTITFISKKAMSIFLSATYQNIFNTNYPELLRMITNVSYDYHYWVQ